eukprot:g16082.t1
MSCEVLRECSFRLVKLTCPITLCETAAAVDSIEVFDFGANIQTSNQGLKFFCNTLTVNVLIVIELHRDFDKFEYFALKSGFRP